MPSCPPQPRGREKGLAEQEVRDQRAVVDEAVRRLSEVLDADVEEPRHDLVRVIDDGCPHQPGQGHGELTKRRVLHHDQAPFAPRFNWPT